MVIAVHPSGVRLASLYKNPASLSWKSRASVPSATKCFAGRVDRARFAK